MLAAAAVGLFAGATILALCRPFGGPVAIKLMGIEKERDSNQKAVTVEFRNCGTNGIYFAGGLKLQARVGDRWLAPEPFPELGESALLVRTNRQEVRFLVPRQAEACRFLLDYRVGGSRYCRVYFFLGRHGLMERFPRASKWVLKLVPARAGWVRVAPEIRLPMAPPELSGRPPLGNAPGLVHG
jgi:hypothetical protein